MRDWRFWMPFRLVHVVAQYRVEGFSIGVQMLELGVYLWLADTTRLACVQWLATGVARKTWAS